MHAPVRASLPLLFGSSLLVLVAGCRSSADADRRPSVGAAPSAAAAEGAPASGEAITVEWIYRGGRTLDDPPRFAWRADDRAFLWDVQVPKEERVLELLDPATGERRVALERDAFRASLEALGVDPDGRWDWPQSFDRSGRRALYVLDEDLFVLDVEAASLRRLTETPEEETSASFSPDGQKVAFVRENDLYAVDLASGSEARLTSDGSDTLLNGTLSWLYWEEIHGRHDVAYWWSADSRSIAYLQTDESPVGVVQYVGFEDPYPEVIEQRYPKAGSANPIVRVGVTPVEAPATTWVDLPEYEYLARVKWLPGDERLAVQTMSRDQRRLELFFVDAGSGASEHVLTETDEGWVNIHDDLWFLGDGEHFLWTSERSGWAHLYLYRTNGELVRQVTGGEWALASAGGGVSWLHQAVCAVDGEHVWFTAQKDGSTERQLYRASIFEEGLERVSEGPGTHSVTFSPSGRRYFDVHSNLHTPPELALHNVDGRERVIAPARVDALEPYGMQYPELLEIPARDGFPMPAWLLKPADFDARREYPLILYVYGGPAAPTVANRWNDAIYFDQVLLDAGYLVARCDNRASTGLSKRTENLILERLASDVERNDILDGARWLKDLPYVDGERVGVWGWSGGGTMTLLMLTRSEAFRAGIAVAPVTDWRYYDTKWAEFAMKRPQDNPEGYALTNLVTRAKDLHGRLLLVHGTYDDNVHPQNAWHFADELIEAGVPFDMMIYPMRKHGISDTAARIHLFEKMVEFWRSWL